MTTSPDAPARSILRRRLWPQSQVGQRRSARDAGCLALVNALCAAISITQSVLVARWLGPQGYGFAVLLMAVSDAVFTFLDARSAEASVKYLGEYHSRRESEGAIAICRLGYTVDLAITSLCLVLVALAAPLVERRILRAPGCTGLMIVYTASFIPYSLTGTSQAVFSTLGRFTTLAWLRSLSASLRCALVLGFVLAERGPVGVIWGNALGHALNGLLLGTAAYPAIRETWGRSWLAGSWRPLAGRRREIFRFLLYNDLTSLLGLTVKQLDVVLLGTFRPAAEVGFYRIAKSIGTLPGYLVGPLQTVCYPQLAQLWGARRYQELNQALHRAAWLGLPLGGALLITLPLLPPLLKAVLGRSFGPATAAAQMILASQAIWLAFFWLRPAFLSCGEVGRWTAGTAVYAGGFFLLAVPAIRLYGHNGLAVAVLLVNLLLHTGLAALLLPILRRHARGDVGP